MTNLDKIIHNHFVWLHSPGVDIHPDHIRLIKEQAREACIEHADTLRSNPPPPADLVDALQDRITPASGKLIKSKPV